MSIDERGSGGLSGDKLRRLLEVSRDLARPFDLSTMLYAVVDAAKELLDAEAGTVWQFHPDENELELRVARGLDPIRIPAPRKHCNRKSPWRARCRWVRCPRIRRRSRATSWSGCSSPPTTRAATFTISSPAKTAACSC